MKLNLGCGTDIKQGYVNLDIIKREGVDVVHNLDSYPYPFPDNHFDEIIAIHLLEHVDDFLKTLEELYRILKPGGKIKAIVPYFSSTGAFQDPTHKHFFSKDTLTLYVLNNGYARDFNYSLASMSLKYTRPFKFLPLIRHVCKFFLLNVVSEMHFTILANKKSI